MKRIFLHIDKLVLRGIDRGDTAAISAGLQAELERRLAKPGNVTPLLESSHRYRIKAGSVKIAPATDGRAMVHAIASSVLKGVSS